MTEDNSRAIGNDFGKTVSRASALAEDGFVVRMYRFNDDPLMTYEELYDEVDAEGSALPTEQWRDGVWDAHEYLIEACLVGIYNTVEVVATVVNRGTGVIVVEYTDDEDEVIARRKVVDEDFG